MTLTIPVERITDDARRIDPVRVLLTVLTAIPFAVGWLLGKAWLAIAWLGLAVLAGWREAARSTPEGEGG